METTMNTTATINETLVNAIVNNEVAVNKVLTAIKIVNAMHNGIAHFKYIKEDGTIRDAFGTLKCELIDHLYGNGASYDKTASKQKNGVSYSKVGDAYTRYYDLTTDENGKVKGWRAFRWDRVLEIC